MSVAAGGGAVPASKRYASRTGGCIVGQCPCSAFEYKGYLDGFITCLCDHTQVSHREEGTINA